MGIDRFNASWPVRIIYHTHIVYALFLENELNSRNTVILDPETTSGRHFKRKGGKGFSNLFCFFKYIKI